ncbi:probable RING zinc finger protein [Listeria monocytogenes str. 4b H7858]|nr:probable RING zinc finger protein [Listeria monocytogenes str. 4b H7858] [Listeria monocytogenes serotype 4b str. H7858]
MDSSCKVDNSFSSVDISFLPSSGSISPRRVAKLISRDKPYICVSRTSSYAGHCGNVRLSI